MTKATLASEFKKLRLRTGKTLRAISAECDLSPAVAWKIENRKPVRWETLHTILSVSLKQQTGSPDYDNIHRLWLQQRKELAESAPATKWRHNLSKEASAAVAGFRKLLQGRPAKEVSEIYKSAARTALRISSSRIDK